MLTRFKIIISSAAFVSILGLSLGCVNKKHDVVFTYPNGTTKALIMSYDDGPIDDIRLARLFEQNGIVGTFNLNSGYLGTTRGWAQKDADSVYQQYMPIDSLPSVYKNHEIASHATFHKDFKNLGDAEILQEVETDLANLNKLTQRPIKSLAYPFGNSSPHIAAVISHTGLTNARTVSDTYAFDLPDTLLLWRPTCHDSKAMGLLDNYLNLRSDSLTVFLVWGHAWEFKDAKRWNDISTFCKTIGNRKDIWYTGCGEFTDYQIVLKQVLRKDGLITNPKDNSPVWYNDQGEVKVLQPGESIKIE